MIQIIPSEKRHHADHGWLQTHWHFSFSDYHDPANVRWSALRVFNDDVIQGGGGFGFHPHDNMEIVTYVIDGELEHRDSLGHRGVVQPGEVQVMSAGTGIVHSEYNASKDKPVHLLQLWLFPRNKDNTPRWEQRRFTREQRLGKLLPVVSSGDVSDTLKIDQDATIYVGSLSAGQSVAHTAQPGRRAYAFVIDGAVKLNDSPLKTGDQARIADETELRFVAERDSDVMLLDLP